MKEDLLPLGLMRVLRYALAILALVSLILWERATIPNIPEKFQGGIAHPELFSSPSPLRSIASNKGDPDPSPKVGSGSLVITVVDQNGRATPGITVEISGPLTTSKRSDREGKVHLTGPAGYYSFRIDRGCTSEIEILSPASGRGGIAEAQEGRGQMQVQWRHRYRPWHPSFSSLTPFWPIGESVKVGFYVIDRCDDNQRAPHARFPTFALEPSPNLQMEGAPSLQADDNGHGYLTLRCLAPGKVSLFAFDKANPSDERVDLLEDDVSSDSPPECR